MNNMNKASVWSLSYFSLLFCIVISTVLILFYLYIIIPYVMVPADILSFAETNFVGDIIKLRIGAPIYTPPEDSNSIVYTPGAPLLTYAIAWLFGKDASIPALRSIQLFFITCAALLATLCCRLLQKIINSDEQVPFHKSWLVLTFLALFLAATAPRMNTFAHTLQSEALSMLVSIFCFFTILLYLNCPNWKRVVLMAICPALGYFTKQNLVSWSVLMFIALLFYNYKNYKHLIMFVILTSLSILLTIGICYLLWGNAFIFWTFEILGGRKGLSFSPTALQLSIPRSLDHTIRAWMEIAIGIVGSLIIFERCKIKKFVPVFIAWILLICLEALISGNNWGTLYHFGPGVVIGCIFLFSVLPLVWPYTRKTDNSSFTLLVYDWLKPVVFMAGIMTVFLALHVVPSGDKQEARYWQRRSLSDVYRYIQDIEKEFEGIPSDQVLLDVGNWIYLRHSILAKDRAVSLADQPPAGIYGNIYVTVNRIKEKLYSKILVRDMHSPFFLYDWYSWEKPSGVRKALSEHYKEIRTIPAVKGNTLPIINRMQAGPISVLIPKNDS